MEAMVEVGRRIRALMPEGMSQRQLAELASMTPDALSRALNGQRGLAPIEVAAIAQVLGADTHWLITGAPDPFAVSIAARHSWDAQRRVRVNNGHQEDRTILDQVVALYRAAYPHGPAESAALPADPEALRDLLGPSFVRTFADRVEERLGIDVIRVPGLTTDYSIRIGGRAIIVLATQSSWFRSNWSLAHELGHLTFGHHSTRDAPRQVQKEEKQVDAFAAGLLLPRQVLEHIARLTDARSAAALVWDLGVSTEAVRNQLRRAKLVPTEKVARALDRTTPRLLRDHIRAIAGGEGPDPIIAREQAASARRFPLPLLSALQVQINLGATSPMLLAWALDVPVDDIDFPEPAEDHDSAYERMLADRPTATYWQSMIDRAPTTDD